MKKKVKISIIILALVLIIQSELLYFQKQEKYENKKINDDFHFIVEKKQIAQMNKSNIMNTKTERLSLFV